MKKIIALLLVAVLLLLNGCTAPEAVSDFLYSKTVRKIGGYNETSRGIVDAVFYGKKLITLTVDVFEDGTSCYTLSAVDTAKAKVINSKPVENIAIENPYGLEIDKDGNILYLGFHAYPEDGSDEEYDESLYCQVFSPDTFEPVGNETVRNDFSYDGADENEVLGEDYASDMEYLQFTSSVYGQEEKRIYAFRDDSEHIFVTELNDFCPYENFGRKIAGTVTHYDDEGYPTDGRFTLAVYDFDENVLLNSVDLREDITSIGQIELNGKYVFFEEEYISDCTEEDAQISYYLWSYGFRKKSEPFSKEEKCVADYESECETLSTAIKDSYGITIHINEQNPLYEDGEDYSLELGVKPFQACSFLSNLLYFLDKMPEGFVREIYCDLPYHEYDGFDIYIAVSVVGTASAYAQTYTENLTICFGMAGSDMGTIAHEFMHAIDARIDDWYSENNDEAFFIEWEKLNPEDFYYTGYNAEDEFEYDDIMDDYFVSTYAMTTDGEDRADLFSNIFLDALSGEKPHWYDKSEPLRKKTDLLFEAIRKSFPSMKNVETAPWETAIGAP